MAWVALVVATTVIFREIDAERGYNLMPFWSYWDYGKDSYFLEMLGENILYVLLFMPVGFWAGCALRGMTIDAPTLYVILPVGISFYTFQALSYTIDVYRRQLPVTRDIISFFAFISFFPQLVADPIERATNLLPQFQNRRTFDYAKAVDGLRQMLWGFFKKLVVADNCAVAVNYIWESYIDQSGLALWIAAFLFTFQIYCDFSGYSDIAIGCARLFGINFRRNFDVPYFSRNIQEFWRRWHISLMTWFRDYVYFPLGGSRRGKWMTIRNILIVFLLSGLFHGADWTFVFWGLYHGLFLSLLLIIGSRSKYKDIVADGIKKIPYVSFLLFGAH